jgi:hypothetical protein
MVPVNIREGEHFAGNQEQEVPNILHLFSIKYQKGENATGFYNLYRKHVMANMKKQGDVIAWKNNAVLSADEEFSPSLEDLILSNVLRRIDVRLPGLVRTQYRHLVRMSRSLMEHKEEILASVPTFLDQIERMSHHAGLESDVKFFARYALTFYFILFCFVGNTEGFMIALKALKKCKLQPISFHFCTRKFPYLPLLQMSS